MINILTPEGVLSFIIYRVCLDRCLSTNYGKRCKDILTAMVYPNVEKINKPTQFQELLVCGLFCFCKTFVIGYNMQSLLENPCRIS